MSISIQSQKRGLSNSKKYWRYFCTFCQKTPDILHSTEDMTQKQALRNTSRSLPHIIVISIYCVQCLSTEYCQKCFVSGL